MNDKDQKLLFETYFKQIHLKEDSSDKQSYYIDGVETFYEPEEDCDDDSCKIWHYFRDKNGKEIKDMDWSPYSTPSPEIINLWIKLGCPDRSNIKKLGASHVGGPITEEQLRNLLYNKSITEKELKKITL